MGSSSWQRPLIVAGSLVLVVGLFYWAQSFLIPVVVAVLLSFILAPVVATLQRRGFGRVFAPLLVVLTLCLLVAGLFLTILLQVQTLADEIPQHKDRIVQKILEVREATKDSWMDRLLSTLGQINEEVQEAEEKLVPKKLTDPVPVKPVPSDWEMLKTYAIPALDILISLGLIIILLIFMLIQREDMRNRILRFSGWPNVPRMTKAIDDAGRRISRFLLMQLIVNVSYGAALGIGLFALGIPYALLWGAIAAAARYVPYLGPWAAALLPITFSFAILDTWTQPLLVVGYIVVLELLSNNVMEPMLYGHSIGVSEVALLISLAFWTWLWGPVGMILATPLTACLAVLGRHVPGLEFLCILLGDQPVLPAHMVYYQRLLAKDEDEASELIEDYLIDHSVEQLFQVVILPAFIRAREGRLKEEVSVQDEQYIYQTTRELLSQVVTPVISEEDRGQESDGAAAEAPAARALVFGCPAQDEADELSLEMFGQILDSRRVRFEVVSHKQLTAEVIARIVEEKPAFVVIASLPPKRFNRARYFCKRLRAQFPDLKILVGCWGLEHDIERTTQRFRGACAHLVATSLVESRAQLMPLVQVSQATQPELARAR